MNLVIRRHLFHFINWVSRTFFASRLSYSHVRAFLFNNSFRKFFNLLHVHWDIWRGAAITSSKPYIFVLEVTNVCNLKCPFCLTGKGISGGREVRHMSYDEATKIIDAVADTTYLLQLYTWGEPLLNKDLIPIIEYAKRRNVYVMLSTNATAMTSAYNDRLLDSGLDYLTVAVDGGSDETYRKYRVGGNYNKILANIKDLLEKKKARSADHLFVEWQFIVFRHNEHETEATERMAYNIGINKFTPLPAYVEDPDWLPQSKGYKKAELYNPERLRNCDRPWSHLNVRADGGVASCCYEFFKSDDFGDLKSENFQQIWNNAFFQESRKLIHQFSETKGRNLDESKLICHDCLMSGIRPSYIKKADMVPGNPVRPRYHHKVIPITNVSTRL
jgi:MoaA/NifB/PqqE/SkfB family radical SAM enzyme